MFETVDLLEKLAEKQRTFSEDIDMILEKGTLNDSRIDESIRTSSGKDNAITLPENSLVFDLSAIQSICEEYRLRFLPGKYFKGEIPYEAYIRIKEIERKTSTEIRDFMIIAPANLFSLKDEYEDPILLAPLGNDRFLFIHKWGNDMSWFRKYLYFPVRNLETYLITITAVSILFTMMIPWNWIVREYSLYEESYIYYRMMLFGSSMTWFFITTFYFLFVTRRNFSRSDWNNVYFNK